MKTVQLQILPEIEPFIPPVTISILLDISDNLTSFQHVIYSLHDKQILQ